MIRRATVAVARPRPRRDASRSASSRPTAAPPPSLECPRSTPRVRPIVAGRRRLAQPGAEVGPPATWGTLHLASRAGHTRWLSAAAPASPADASSSQGGDSQSKEGSDKSKSKKDDSNIFLDNLGKIFLSSIGLVLLMLLRSTKSNNSRTALREDVENSALLDPLEIDDLRNANSDFTVEIWRRVSEAVWGEFRGREGVTYPEFLTLVMRTMREIKGEGFTIQLGHLVDRVVIAELERSDGDGEGDLTKRELPLPFLMAALSLALHSTVADRVRVLYEVMVNEDDGAPDTGHSVPGERVSDMIRHLQKTCQLIPDAQIVETESKVPYQTFRVGTGDELARRARAGFGGKKGSAGVTAEAKGPMTLEDFHAVLKSRTVCAWGECHVKMTGRMATSDR